MTGGGGAGDRPSKREQQGATTGSESNEASSSGGMTSRKKKQGRARKAKALAGVALDNGSDDAEEVAAPSIVEASTEPHSLVVLERKKFGTFLQRKARYESDTCDGCGVKEHTGHCGELLRCTKCRCALFCSRECQVAVWDSHKEFCRDTLIGNILYKWSASSVKVVENGVCTWRHCRFIQFLDGDKRNMASDNLALCRLHEAFVNHWKVDWWWCLNKMETAFVRKNMKKFAEMHQLINLVEDQEEELRRRMEELRRKNEEINKAREELRREIEEHSKTKAKLRLTKLMKRGAR